MDHRMVPAFRLPFDLDAHGAARGTSRRDCALAHWEARGEGGALGEERLQAFHAEAASALAPTCACVDRVTLSGRTIAGLYAFVLGRVKYCYLQGVDLAYANLSPGLLLLGLVVEDAQERGIEHIDFLRGDEPYKIAWGATCVANARRRLWLRTDDARTI
jgi:Acetyltransferase (GNAT) domain